MRKRKKRVEANLKQALKENPHLLKNAGCQRAEREAILQALALTGRNLSRTAELLGITRPTLYDLLDKNEIADPERTVEG